MMRALLPPIAALLLAACSSGGEDQSASGSSQAPEQVSLFEGEVQPLLTRACATCHMTGTEAGEMSLVPGKAIGSLVGVNSVEATDLLRVKPGDPDASYLVMKLEGTHLENGGSGAQMPFAAPPLPAEKIALVRRWIAEGAKP